MFITKKVMVVYSSDGKIINEYDEVYNISNGFAIVRKNNLYGFIDENGKETILPKYDDANRFHENGVAIVMKNDCYGLINTNGKEITKFKYSHMFVCDNGLIYAKVDNSCGIVDKNGIEIIPIGEYDEIVYLNKNIFKYRVGEFWGIISKEGKRITTPKFRNIKEFGNGIFGGLTYNMKYAVINEYGIEITPAKYDNIYEVWDSFCIVVLNGKVGIINMKGEEITSFIYDDIEVVNGNFLIVGIGLINAKYGIISLEGKTLIECKYDKIAKLTDEYFSIYLDKKVGVIDSNANEILPVIYDTIYLGANSRKDYIYVRKKGKYGLFSKEGNEIIPAEYNHISELYYGVFRVEKNEKSIVYFDEKGNRISDKVFSMGFPFHKDGTAKVIYKNKKYLLFRDGYLKNVDDWK